MIYFGSSDLAFQLDMTDLNIGINCDKMYGERHTFIMKPVRDQRPKILLIGHLHNQMEFTNNSMLVHCTAI